MVLHLRVAVLSWLLGSALVTVTAGGCSSSSNAGPFPLSTDATTGGSPGDSPTLPGDASACRPGDVETYRPLAYRPATGAHKGVCTQIQISLFYRDCLGPQGTSTECSAFMSDKVTGACAACIITQDTADHYGPVIDHGGFVTPNVAGCIELTGSYPCAKSVQALSGCELAACEANCPVHDMASRAAYDACAAQADHGGCQYYAMAAQCTGLLQDAGQTSSCLLPVFQDFYNAVVPLFCGSPPQRPDAGLTFDAGGDSGTSDAWADDSASPADASNDAPFDGQIGALTDAQRE